MLTAVCSAFDDEAGHGQRCKFANCKVSSLISRLSRIHCVEKNWKLILVRDHYSLLKDVHTY